MNLLEPSNSWLAVALSAIAMILNPLTAAAETTPAGLRRFSYWQRLCQLQQDAADYAAAQSACETALTIDPAAGDIWLAYSQLLLRQEQYAEAIAATEAAIELGETPALALTYQCAAWLGLGRTGDGLSACDHALALNEGWGDESPDLAKIYRGRLLAQQADEDAALDIYAQILEVNAENSQILTHQCEALFVLQSYEQALSRCEAALEQNQHWGILEPAQADYVQGQIYAAQGLLAEAIAAFDRAIRTNASQPQIWADLGSALAQLNRSAEALAAHTRAVDLQPDFFQGLVGRCAGLNQAGDYEAAEAVCQQAIAAAADQDLNAAPAWSEKAQALAGQADYPAALAAANRAVSLDPDDATAWNHQGVILWYLDDFPQAIAALQRSAAIAPDSPQVYANLARMLRSTNQLEPALEAYDKALELDADSSRIWGDRSGVLWALERYAAALESADQAIEIDSNQYLGWFNRAAALAALDRPADALIAYQQAVRINPQSANAWTGLGAVLGQLNRYAEAETALATALNINPQQPVAQALWRRLSAAQDALIR